MVTTRAARRYARAVFDLAEDDAGREAWQSDLALMADRLSRADVLRLVGDPAVKIAAKQALVDQALARMDRLRLHLAYLLIERGRLAELPAIAAEYDRLMREHKGIAEAEVTTAVPLSRSAAQDVQQRLAALTGKQVILHEKVDPSIIGGLIVRLGDRLIDGSLATRLESLRSQLAG